MELAELKGTEKQVNWAKAIRKDRLAKWQGTDSDRFQEVESMLTSQGVASWWIVSKDKSLEQVCGQLLSGAKAKAPDKKTSINAPLKFAIKTADEEVWNTVATATGFTRSGPTKDMVTGEVVDDAAIPF
jgi:hypothetical protein